MKYLSVAILALASLAAAQSRDDIPKCAQPCLNSSIEEASSCATDDFVCVCTNLTPIQGAATGCILSKCGADVAIGEVLPAVQKLCKEALANAPSSSAGSPRPTKKPSGSVTATVVAPSATQPAATTAVPPPVATGAAAAIAPAGLAMLVLGALAL